MKINFPGESMKGYGPASFAGGTVFRRGFVFAGQVVNTTPCGSITEQLLSRSFLNERYNDNCKYLQW